MVVLATSKQEGECFGSGGRRRIALPKTPRRNRMVFEGSLGGETVSDARFGQQVAWLGWVVFQLAPETGDKHPEVMRLLRILRPPNLPEQEAMREHFAGVLEQGDEQLVLQRREMDFLAGPSDDPGGQVHPQIADRNDRRLRGAPIRVPQRRSHAGEQFADPERFRHVVVGAGVQSRDFLLFLVAGGKHDHGAAQPLPELPQYLLPVDPGKSEVEDHEVGRLLDRAPDSLFACPGLDDTIALGRQGGPQEAPDGLLVVDDQDQVVALWHGSFDPLRFQPPGLILLQPGEDFRPAASEAQTQHHRRHDCAR